jgi:hypothetical protein
VTHVRGMLPSRAVWCCVLLLKLVFEGDFSPNVFPLIFTREINKINIVTIYAKHQI